LPLGRRPAGDTQIEVKLVGFLTGADLRVLDDGVTTHHEPRCFKPHERRLILRDGAGINDVVGAHLGV
jgi:hypothetical protein